MVDLRSASPSASIVTSDAVLRRGKHTVFDGLTCELPGGASTALIGANGSGKTTLLHALAGLLAPQSGTVQLPPGPVGYVLQHTATPRWMPLTIAEVLTMGRYPSLGLLGRLRRRDRTIVADAAERLEVGDLLGRQFGEVSGGQRQRVLVAQALVQEPTVLLLDEPLTGLDLASQQRIVEVVDAEAAAGHTVVLSTHHLDEARQCDHVVLLDGRVIAAGSPAQVLTSDHLRTAYGERVLDLTVLDDHGHDHAQ